MLGLDFLGFTGLIFILIAWLPETIKNIRNSAVNSRWGFLILYTIGSFLLTIYSLLLNNLVFSILNGLAVILAAINIFFKLRFNHNKKLIN